MKFKINIKNLEKFRNDLINLKDKEEMDIKDLLKWRINLIKKNKFSSKLINLNNIKDWHADTYGNIHHKSSQFFSIKGVRIKNAQNREVKSWDQPILTQRHGGVLALLARETEKRGIEFLLEAKLEPGDNGDIKFCPSYQATISNINRAHGGNKPKLSDIILNQKGAKLIYATSHNEEGGRFWKKTNFNLLLILDKKNNNKIKDKNFIWASLAQIKKLSLLNNKVSPFVKTILFMI
jgi:dTDP-4-dehydro-6-deoxy-alpha-D-glucopyranose 2,3-dehydratase